ncbi:MAG TPA: polymer-forming cytoskeletal protein [Candidatus Limnocylindria bacterium]|nr:polymer-forming cytoskeletal protein [Candidatus Limnocylindria bacterium]
MMRGIGKRSESTPAVTLPLTTTEREGEDKMALSTTRPDTTSQRYDTAAPRYDSAAQTRPAGTGELNALLGKGSEFDGKLTFEGTVRIDGTFSGEITTSDTLIVGEGAKVSAEISCGTLIVHGEITGNISASAAVELHKPARVKGDVTTPALVIERGVFFQGTSKMTEQTSSNVVRFASTAESASD